MGQSQSFHRTMAVVVEDDEDQRLLSATLLEEADFEVAECETADEALKIGYDIALLYSFRHVKPPEET